MLNYRIFIDGKLIYSPYDDTYKIYDAKLELNQNDISTFEFTLLESKTLDIEILRMKSQVDVYQGDERIFKGIVIEDDRSMDNEVSIKCKDDLYYLAQTLQRPASYGSSTTQNRIVVNEDGDEVETSDDVTVTVPVAGIFKDYINKHNDESIQKFTIGNVEIEAQGVVENTDYKTTWDAISALISDYGGFLDYQLNGDDRVISWVKDFTKTAEQEARFSSNLTDVQINETALDMATVLIPTGDTVESSQVVINEDGDEEQVSTSKVTTIKDVNGGLDYIQDDEAVAKYGRIMKHKSYTGITDPQALLEVAKTDLAELVKHTQSITVKMIDLAGVDDAEDPIFLGKYIVINDPMNNIHDKYLPLKISRDLFNPENNEIELTATRQTQSATAFNGTINSASTGLVASTSRRDSEYMDIVKAQKGYIDELHTKTLDVEYLLTAFKGKFKVFESDSAKIKDLETDFLQVNGTANINKANIDKLNNKVANIDTLTNGYARIGVLDNDLANIKSLLAGNVNADGVQSIVINSQNSTIANGVITNAMIQNLSFDKITGFDINTTKLTIHSADGRSTWKDNTIQIKDANNKLRVQLGKDAKGDYTIYLYDKDGKVLFDPLGLTADGINRQVIDNDAVMDNAMIAGSKLDIDDVIKEVNGAKKTIKSSRIYFDDQKQTLNVVLNSITESTSSAVTTADAANSAANQANSIANLAKTTAENTSNSAVKNVTVEYAVNTSNSTAPTTGWASSTPKWSEGSYIWSRTVATRGDGTNVYSNPTCVTGHKGATGAQGLRGIQGPKGEQGTQGPKGDQGIQGPKGATGVSFKTFTTNYTYNQSQIGAYSASDYSGTWAVNESTSELRVGDTVQLRCTNSSKSGYCFIIAKVTAIPGDKLITCVSSGLIDKGDMGATGAQGPKGLGVKAVVPQYYLSTSNASQSGGSWTETQPAWTSGKYIWTRSKVTWDDNSVTYSSPILANGINSANDKANQAYNLANTANGNASNALNKANSAVNQANMGMNKWLVTEYDATDSSVIPSTMPLLLLSRLIPISTIEATNLWNFSGWYGEAYNSASGYCIVNKPKHAFYFVTYLKYSKDTSVPNFCAYLDDKATVYLNGEQIIHTDTYGRTSPINVVFKFGWNVLELIIYNNYGGGGFFFNTYDSTNKTYSALDLTKLANFERMDCYCSAFTGQTAYGLAVNAKVLETSSSLETVSRTVTDNKNGVKDLMTRTSQVETNVTNLKDLENTHYSTMTTLYNNQQKTIDGTVTRLGKAEDRITTVSNDLSNLSIGGRNLCLNSAHLEKINIYGNGVSIKAQAINDGGNYNRPTNALKITLGKGQSGFYFDSNYLDKLVDGHEYVVSMYICCQNRDFDNFNFVDCEWMRNKVWINNPKNDRNNEQRIAFRGTYYKDAPYRAMTFYPGNISEGETYWISAIQVEEGNKLTSWSPAPEDVDASVADAKKAGTDAQTTANTAVANAKTAQDTADSANKKATATDLLVSNWCNLNDKTLIDGSKIYTGTITADKLNVNEMRGTNGVIYLKDGTFDYGSGKLKWDGSSLTINGKGSFSGSISASTITGGTISGATISGVTISGATLTGDNTWFGKLDAQAIQTNSDWKTNSLGYNIWTGGIKCSNIFGQMGTSNIDLSDEQVHIYTHYNSNILLSPSYARIQASNGPYVCCDGNGVALYGNANNLRVSADNKIYVTEYDGGVLNTGTIVFSRSNGSHTVSFYWGNDTDGGRWHLQTYVNNTYVGNAV